MATITHTCAQCGKRLGVPERYLGRDLKCPGCGNPFRIDPEPQAAATTPESAPLPEPGPTGAPPAAPAGRTAPAAATLPPPFPGEEPSPPSSPTQEPVFGLTNAVVTWRVRRLGVLSTALTSAVIHAVLGLVVGALVALVGMLPRAAGVAVSLLRGPLLGAAALVGLPLLYAAVGFVSGVVLALLYNLAARLTGGVELTME
ncbi:MAG: hypothetical protein ACM3O7_04935 [Acidobacteriota bacterium]